MGNAQNPGYFSLTAGADLSDKVGYFVLADGTVCTSATALVVGVVAKGCASGEQARIQHSGVALISSDTTSVAIGDGIVSSVDGQGSDTSGIEGQYIHAVALEAAAAAGSLFAALLCLNSEQSVPV